MKFFVFNLKTNENCGEITENEFNHVNIDTHTIVPFDDDGNKCKFFVGKELERNKKLFWEIHLKWTPFLKSKCWNRKKKVSEDIVQDYLVWFMNYHVKFFNFHYKNEKNTPIEDRARNFYIRRFNFFLNNESHSSKVINRKYGISPNDSDVELSGFLYGSNKTVGNNVNTKNFANYSLIEDNNAIELYMGLIDSNINLDLQKNYKPMGTFNRYNLSDEERLYFEGLLDFINNKIEMYNPTKEKIINFLNLFIKTGEINLKNSFGTTTTYYRNIIGNFIKEYDNVFGEIEPEKPKGVRYQVIYGV